MRRSQLAPHCPELGPLFPLNRHAFRYSSGTFLSVRGFMDIPPARNAVMAIHPPAPDIRDRFTPLLRQPVPEPRRA